MSRRSVSIVFSLLALTAARGALAESAGGTCVGEDAKKVVATCPGGPSSFNLTGHGKAPQMSFHSAPPPIDLKKRDQQTKPTMPSEQMSSAQRDDRKSVLQARQRALLTTEIQQLEMLYKSTAQNAPDRPDIARRLAETYVEFESSAFREKTEAEVARDTLKKSNPTEAGKKQAVADQAGKFMKVARKEATKYYSVLKDEYPNYPKLDEVLYYLAYEYEQSSDNNNARKVYLELIDKRPNSKYVPNAYLAFGELFFNEAQGDPSKWDLAAQAYKKVINSPPPDNKVYGYAWYKLAYVFWNKGEYESALNAFKKTVDYGVTYAQLPNAAKLADSARKDIVPVYALSGRPDAAYNFFHNISGDAAGANDKTFKMMDDLGANYLDTGHYREAILLYKDLGNRDRSSEKQCAYQGHITEATMALNSANKDAVRGELENQLKVFSEYKAGSHSAEAKQECANKSAELVTETAMAWHLEAVGSEATKGKRGTGDQKTMALSAFLYDKVVKNWNADEFSKFQFPKLVKEDWPNIYKIRYNMADLLYFQQKWAECGPAFDAVVAENPNAPEATEAAYAAVLCYQNIYEAAHKDKSDRKGGGNMPGGKKKDKEEDEAAKLRPKNFNDTQKGMLQAFNRYVCYIKPAADDQQGQEQLVEVKYARARTYFEAQHWEEASLAFHEIAMNHSDREVGIYAAQLYLESANVLGSHSQPPRPACFEEMAVTVPKFIELYCTGEKATKYADQCLTLNKIQVDILRLRAQKLVEVADKSTGTGGLQAYEQAGAAYMDLYRNYCQAPMREGKPAAAERCDEIVYNSARAYQAGRLVAKAIAVRMVLLDPQNKMENSPLAKKALYEIGGNYQAIAVYEMASEYYERYQKADPKGEKADQALSDAIILRLGLGDEEKAIQDADAFNRAYGQSKQAQTAGIAFAIGAHYAEKAESSDDKANWEKARTSLQRSMSVIEKAPPDIQVQAYATLGRALTKLKKDTEARNAYGKVRGLWSDPAASVAKINAAYASEDEGTRGRRLAKALTAVGEAYFYAAEEMKKKDVDTLKFPEYKGPGTKDEVMKHINTKVKDWLEKKVPAIDKVAAEYKKIVELQPDAPPRWVIAAGSRVGLMWGDLVDDFRRAPIPEAWKKDAEIRGIYYDALDAKSEPLKIGKAKPALVTCLTYSTKFQYFDQFSRSCEEWLAKNYKAEYHVVDELRGAPTLSNSGLDDKPPPVLIGGASFHERPEGAPDKSAAPEKTDEATPGKGGTKPKPAPRKK